MREVDSLHADTKKVGTRRRGANFSMIIRSERGKLYRLWRSKKRRAKSLQTIGRRTSLSVGSEERQRR